MRAVTEPYWPAVIDDERGHATRVTERRAQDTCAVDRAAVEAALASACDDTAMAADLQPAGEVAEVAAEPIVNCVAPLAALPCAPPVWAQLLHLEELVCQWMTANPACDRAAIAEMREREARTFVAAAPARQTAKGATPAQPAASDYVAKLAAKLIRRSA